MLDEAEFTIMGFIKGPVCRGQVALNVIEDRFWVFFLADADLQHRRSSSWNARSEPARLAGRQLGSDAGIIVPWRRYAKRQAEYLQAKSAFLDRYASTQTAARIRMDLERRRQRMRTPALTVFRHFDNALGVKGLVGDPPKTAWVLGYGLLERIHYLLVAGFDVYGNVGHQLLSRLYMDFLRMEGEFNFLTFLPLASARQVRDYWYRGASQEVKNHVYGDLATFRRRQRHPFRSDQAAAGVLRAAPAAYGTGSRSSYDLAQVSDAALREDLATLAALRGRRSRGSPRWSSCARGSAARSRAISRCCATPAIAASRACCAKEARTATRPRTR
jgi:hypothetical protein